MLLVEARLKDNILENKDYFNEFDKCQILTNQIISTLNHVPFSMKGLLDLDGTQNPDMFKFF